jgi:quercetin dioxygenase-like cupin family protein
MTERTSDGRATPARPGETQPVFLPPDSGRHIDFLAVTHRLTSDQSDGSISIFESAFEPESGNRLHVHRHEDEIAYVLEGALEVRLRDRTAILEVGGVGRLPRGLAHAVRNPLKTPSRYLFLAVPGGLDRLFDAWAAAQAAGSLDDALFRSLSDDHGIAWLE